MKAKLSVILVLILIAFGLKAQLPTSFNYQAVARDGSGNVLESTPLIVELSIRQASPSGIIVWQEGHNVTTNGFGLFTVKIGTGASTGIGTLPTFDSIKWWLDAYFMSIRIDFGNGLVDMGTSQFLSVPYALYAHMSGSSVGGTQKLSIVGQELGISNGNSVTLPINIQTLSLAGKTLSISNGNSVTLNVDDADADPANEIQSLSLTGNNLSISGGNTVTLTDNVNDGDTNSINEIQSLSLSGLDLSISGGNKVTLPSSVWTKNGSNIYYKPGNVSIGTKTSYHDSTLFTLADSLRKNIPALAYYYGIGADNFFNSSKVVWANMEATNGENSAFYGSSIGNSGGNNRGVFGYAKSANTNYGVYGEANAGVKTNNNNYGVYGYSSGTTSNFNIGVFGESKGSTGYNRGLDGRTNGTGTYNDGVFGHSIGTGSGQNRGMYGFAQGSGFVNYGVLAETRGKGSWNIAMFADANGAATTNYSVYGSAVNAATNYAGFFSGNVTVTGTFTNPSDAFLKDDIEKVASPLALVKNLNPVTYYFKKEYTGSGLNLSNGLQYGFIAQELESVVPELVSKQEAPIITKENGEIKDIQKLEFKGINYIGLIPILTGAIKEQQEIIEKQQNEIQNLKNQNQMLLDKMNQFDARLKLIEVK